MSDSDAKKILVVDDNPTDRTLIISLLERAGHMVVSADQAPDGVDMALNQAPDLIILDVMMPIINGFNICRLIKSHTEQGHIPIVLVTSRAEEEDRHIGEEVGADGYITKPFDPEILLETVSGLLSQ
ncbi:MAG: response regulator transcription factor [Candidatus Omnitrophota bacterium]